MASARKSRNMNKRFGKVNEELHDRDGVNSSRRTKKRKLSDMLGFQWSKDELECFYEAYRKHGRDWRKIAAAVQNRSPEMVEALYNMNKGYLSLSEGHATAAGLIAKMTDHYNILEVSSKEESDHVAPSATVGPSTSVPVEEYSEKEMNIPIKESDECWWDSNAPIFSMRYNRKVRYVPDLLISKIPAAVLDSLIINEDKEMLEKYTEKELAQLQAHLAFSSALVSKYISGLSSIKDSALETKENSNRKLRQENAELGVKIKTIEKELTIEKEKMKEEMEAHKKEIDDLNAKMLSVVNELDGLRNEYVSQKKSAKEMEMRLETEMTSWKSESENLLSQIAVLKKQQEDITAPPPSSTPTVEEVVAMYKRSDDFHKEILEFSIHGFDLLKRILVKDGHVEKSLVDGYSFESCIERDDEDDSL